MVLYGCMVTTFYESGAQVTLSRMIKVTIYTIILRATTKKYKQIYLKIGISNSKEYSSNSKDTR